MCVCVFLLWGTSSQMQSLDLQWIADLIADLKAVRVDCFGHCYKLYITVKISILGGE